MLLKQEEITDAYGKHGLTGVFAKTGSSNFDNNFDLEYALPSGRSC